MAAVVRKRVETKEAGDQDEGKKYLDVLFPGEVLKMGGGQDLTIRPLSLESLAKVLEAFTRVATLYKGGMSVGDIAVEAFKELMQLLPHCLDRDVSEVPATMAPDVLTVFLNQNLSGDVLSKWTTLIQKLAKDLGIAVGVPQPQPTPAADQGSDIK